MSVKPGLTAARSSLARPGVGRGNDCCRGRTRAVECCRLYRGRGYSGDIRDSHLFTVPLSSPFIKVWSRLCVCTWVGRRQALAVDPPAPRGAIAPKRALHAIAPGSGGGNGANASTVVGPRAEPGAIGGVAANDQRLSAAIITSHGKVEKGGESAQGGGSSDTEAYACACVLQAILEAQP